MVEREKTGVLDPLPFVLFYIFSFVVRSSSRPSTVLSTTTIITRMARSAIAAWYDYDLKTYQRDRQDGGELQKRFDDRGNQVPGDAGDLIRKKSVMETETEWQRQVKNKKSDDYYKNLKEV